MPTVVEVANWALRMIGEARIASLTDGSNQANVISDIYEQIRDDLLGTHSWNFAAARAELARDATAPAFGFTYRYALPADWIRTVSVHDNDAGIGTIDHKEEGLFIHASVENVFLRYVKRVTDANSMTAQFRRAWASALARDLCLPLTVSNTLYDRMEAQAKRDLARAKSSDSMAGFPDPRPRGSWANSRGGWRTRGVWPS